MKNFILALFIVLPSLIFSQTSAFPKASLKSLDGKPVEVQELFGKHKYTFVSFWATWCGPCKRELDAIADLYPSLKERYDLNVVAVSIDDARNIAKLPSMIAAKGWEYTILVDQNQSLQKVLNFTSIPQSYIVDQAGNIVYGHQGYNPGDEFEIEDVLKKLKQ